MLSRTELSGRWKSYYLPYLRRPQVEQLLSDGLKTAAVPVGSIEQHAEHLPLGTDYYGVEEVCKAAAEECELLIVPALQVGVSHHHMGFAGSLTISEETLSGLLVEVGRSLGQHGIKNLILVNGHGGNGKAVGQAADRLSSTGELTARAFPTKKQFFRLFLEEFADHFDSHSGVEETSRALHAFPELVDMSTAGKPHLQLDDDQLQAIENREEDPETYRQLLSPLPPLHELTDTGALTLLDIAEHASADLGERNFHRFVEALVSLVKELEAV